MNFKKILVLFVFTLLLSCEKTEFISNSTEIFPPQTLHTVALFRLDHLNIASSYFKGRWSIVLLNGKECKTNCKDALTLLNNNGKLQSLFVFDQPVPTEEIRNLKDQFLNVAITVGSTAQSMEYFLAHFEVDSIDKKDKYKHLYFINPEGALAYVLPLNELSKSDLDSEIEWLVNL